MKSDITLPALLRWFGGRQLVAHMYDGHTNYAVKVKESVEDQATRLEAFSRELEDKAASAAAAGSLPSSAQ